MGRDGLLIGQVATKSGVSRKALRLYESAGLIPPPRRTAAGYRVYGAETLATITFIDQARRLGFRLNEIKEVVQIRRSGRCPCPHVLELVRQKVTEPRPDPCRPDRAPGHPSGAPPVFAHRPTRQQGRRLPPHRAPDAHEGEEVNTMENLKVTLCPAGCGACPDVEITDEGVRIGEAGNLAVLKKEEWNLLVELIYSGQLKKV